MATWRENELFLNNALHVTCSFADTSTPDKSILSYVFSDREFFVLKLYGVHEFTYALV